MEKNTRTKNILLVVLLVAVLTLSISYAALSQYLYINSTAVVSGKSTVWNVAFTSVSCNTSQYAEITSEFTQAATISEANPATTLSGLSATLKAPGAQVTCAITVKNQGSIDADLSTFTLNAGTVDVTGSGTNQSADEALVSGNYIYSIVYANDDTVASAQGQVPGASGVDDTIPAYDSTDPTASERHLILTIGYPDTNDSQSLPDNDVTISGLSTSFLYVQN